MTALDGDSVILHHLSDAQFPYYTISKLEQLKGVSHDKRAHLDVRLKELIDTKQATESNKSRKASFRGPGFLVALSAHL